VKALDQYARADHPYLSAADQCWCLGDYLPGSGYRRGALTQLIGDLKRSPASIQLHPCRRQYKQRAVRAIAALLREQVAREWAESVTWIPIPPSRPVDHRDFDNRLTAILRAAFADYDVDIRTVLYQVISATPDHMRRVRCDFENLYMGLRINWEAIGARPLSPRLVLFDDVLTTGKHFRCCERRLHQALPHVRVSGLFVARRVLSGRGRRLP
jgi:predicted amidophosphoribosyltransferase